ncbi:AAA family ATPase [Parabacteroides johnsonii]|uniref:AAA family ATPase n=1 Tax=Parabacteroides johnsonii TaxID=387661 RepID=UPI003F2809E0
MSAINKIHITGFKAFPNDFELELEGKHLLMYGENGSGKSSIYYALHCIFQAPLKSDAGKKYFDVANEQHLKNIDNIAADSKIWIDFEGRHPFIYQIDKNGYNTTLIDGTHPLPASINGCFINHQFLFHFFNFRNSQSINLFPVFIKDILSFCKDEKSGLHIGEMYDEITTSIVKRGKRIDPTYISNIEYFNKAVKEVVENINIYASDIYNKHFRDDDNLELQIRLRYDSNLDKPTDDPNEYWLKYDKVIEYTKENGILKEHLSSYKKLNKPFIGLEISERQSDGSFRKITKPHTYFNEAKLTAIALSVRFALLNLEKPADGRFLALDDMLISLDMSNRAKVVAFLLSISDKYKIYLFTHDKMFFEYFKHKTRCSKQEWVYKEIYMDDSKAPYLRNSNDYLGQAEHFIKQHEYEIAGNFCRKAAESICKKFLPRKWQLSLDYTLLDLNGLIQNCKTFASESGVKDLSVFEKLDEYRKFILNPSSHDNYDVVKYRYEVENCLEALHSFDSIEVKPFMEYGAKVYFELKEPIPSINVYKFEISLCDDFRVIKQNGQEPIISKGMINYRVIKNGVIGDRKTDNTTLRHFYDVNYNRSDKSGNSNFLEGIFDAKSNNSINMML